MPLIRFDSQDPQDGELWLLPEDVRRVERAPNRRTAARVWFYADGREQYFTTKATPEDVAAQVNKALAATE